MSERAKLKEAIGRAEEHARRASQAAEAASKSCDPRAQAARADAHAAAAMAWNAEAQIEITALRLGLLQAPAATAAPALALGDPSPEGAALAIAEVVRAATAGFEAQIRELRDRNLALRAEASSHERSIDALEAQGREEAKQLERAELQLRNALREVDELRAEITDANELTSSALGRVCEALKLKGEASWGDALAALESASEELDRYSAFNQENLGKLGDSLGLTGCFSWGDCFKALADLAERHRRAEEARKDLGSALSDIPDAHWLNIRAAAKEALRAKSTLQFALNRTTEKAKAAEEAFTAELKDRSAALGFNRTQTIQELSSFRSAFRLARERADNAEAALKEARRDHIERLETIGAALELSGRFSWEQVQAAVEKLSGKLIAARKRSSDRLHGLCVALGLEGAFTWEAAEARAMALASKAKEQIDYISEATKALGFAMPRGIRELQCLRRDFDEKGREIHRVKGLLAEARQHNSKHFGEIARAAGVEESLSWQDLVCRIEDMKRKAERFSGDVTSARDFDAAQLVKIGEALGLEGAFTWEAAHEALGRVLYELKMAAGGSLPSPPAAGPGEGGGELPCIQVVADSDEGRALAKELGEIVAGNARIDEVLVPFKGELFLHCERFDNGFSLAFCEPGPGGRSLLIMKPSVSEAAMEAAGLVLGPIEEGDEEIMKKGPSNA